MGPMRDRSFTVALIAAVAAGVLLGIAPHFLWEFGGYRDRGEWLLGVWAFHVLSLVVLPMVVGVIWWVWLLKPPKGPADSPGLGCLLLGLVSVLGLGAGFILTWTVL